MPTPSLSPNNLMTVVNDITQDSQTRIADVSNRLNAVTLTIAIQEGYRLACMDNGITPPNFDDPRKFWNV